MNDEKQHTNNEQQDAEVETLRRENEELREAMRARAGREAVMHELEQLGAASPELLFMAAQHEVQFDSAGTPANAAALAAELKSRFPEQFRNGPIASIDAGAGTNNRARPLTRETLSRMTSEEI